MTIATKLVLAFVGLAALIVVLTVSAVAPLQQGIQGVGQFHAPAFEQVQSLESDVNATATEVLDYAVSVDPTQLEEYRFFVAKVENGLSAYRALVHPSDDDQEIEAVLLGRIIESWARLQLTAERIFECATRTEMTPEHVRAFETRVDELRDLIAELEAIEHEEVHEAQALANATLIDARRALFINGALATMAALALALVVSRTITRPIRRLKDAAADAARGHAVRVDVAGTDELAVLAQAFNEMLSEIDSARGSLETTVTERTRELASANESLRASESSLRQLGIAVENAMTGIAQLDKAGCFVMVRDGYASLLGYEPGELVGQSWTVTVLPDDVPQGIAAYEEMLREGRAEAEYRGIRKDGSVLYKHVLLVPSVDARGERDGHYCFTRDITERKSSESHMQLMMHELDHRVKNTLASVLSLSTQTAASAATPGEFADKLNGRIMSLARTHEALAEAKWAGSVLEELVLLTTDAYHDRAGAIRVRGPRIHLSARASGPVSLALHELSTNAAKYGSLSRSEGSVDVDWTRDEAGGLLLRWREQGGPRIDSPCTPGLGTRLVRGLIEHELGGTVELDFAPDGLLAKLYLPPDCLVAESSADTGAPRPTLEEVMT